MALGKPRLTGKTPDDLDFNALLEDGFHDSLLREYHDPSASATGRHVGIIVFNTVRVVDEKDKGQQANIMIQHLEVPTGANAEAVEELLISAFRNRTKKQGFPGESAAAGGTPLDLSGLDEFATGNTQGDVAAAVAAGDAAFDAAAPTEGVAPVTPIK